MKKQLFGILATVGVVAGAVSAAASAQAETAVTILHGIPGITVDLRVDGEVVIAGFDAGDTQDFTPLAGTELTNIEAVRAGGDEVVIGPIDSFTVPSEGNTSVVVHLDNSGSPTITPFTNSAPPSEQGRGLFTVRHVADASPVAVSIADESVITGIGNGQEGSVVLPAGEVSDAWITADGARIAAVPTLALEANSQLIVYVGGSLEAANLEFYLQQVSASGIESVATPMEQAEPETDDGEATRTEDGETAQQTDDGDDDDGDDVAGGEADDGTPQPSEVNTGAAIDASSGNPVVLGAGVALLVLAAVALLARRRVLAGISSATGLVTPWGPPSADTLVRRADTPQS